MVSRLDLLPTDFAQSPTFHRIFGQIRYRLGQAGDGTFRHDYPPVTNYAWYRTRIRTNDRHATGMPLNDHPDPTVPSTKTLYVTARPVHRMHYNVRKS